MMDWKPLLAYIPGTVDQALLVRNEYLVTENRTHSIAFSGNLLCSITCRTLPF